MNNKLVFMRSDFLWFVRVNNILWKAYFACLQKRRFSNMGGNDLAIAWDCSVHKKNKMFQRVFDFWLTTVFISTNSQGPGSIASNIRSKSWPYIFPKTSSKKQSNLWQKKHNAAFLVICVIILTNELFLFESSSQVNDNRGAIKYFMYFILK